MKTKLIFSAIIAAIFIAAMVIFHNTMDLTEIILAFVGASGTIGWIWKWITAKEKEEKLQEEKQYSANLESLLKDSDEKIIALKREMRK